jgi:sulfite exporter TauE/SafE
MERIIAHAVIGAAFAVIGNDLHRKGKLGHDVSFVIASVWLATI